MTIFRQHRQKFFVLVLSAPLCFATTSGHAQTWQSSKEVARAARAAVLRSLANDASGSASAIVTVPQTEGWVRECNKPLKASLSLAGCQAQQCAVAVSCAHPRWTLSMMVSIIYREPVVEAVNYLPAGAVIENNEVTVKIVAVGPGVPGLAHRLDDVVGKIPTAGISAGMPVNPGLLVGRKLVHEGEPAVVVARFGAVRAKTTGIAVTGGAAGDKVLVRNPASGQVLTGIVQENGTVLLN